MHLVPWLNNCSEMKIRLFTIPNILTLLNLLCGANAVLRALVFSDLTGAFWWIALAAAFDFLDGFVARLLKESSPIGVQLDSLADDISFGFAPAAVLYALYVQMPGIWLGDRVGFIVFVFSAFAALRLAKFNIDDTQHTEFCGLPTPAATLLCASVGMLAEVRGWVVSREMIVLLAVVVALLMVSPIRMFALKFSGFGWRGNEVRYLFLAFCVVAIAVLRPCSIPVIIVLYILISTARWIFGRK